MDMAAFALKMQKRADDLPNQVNEAKKEVSKAALHTAVNGTPVDTSKAISNWNVNIGKASAPVREPFFPGRRGSTRGESIRATIAKGDARIEKVKPGQEVHIANGVDYIKALNDGTISRQPGGFVEAALTVGRNKLKTLKVIPDN